MLRQLPRSIDAHLLVGIDTADDAGVYQINDQTALIQTVDFFTPLVDDPFLFGQIAAANSLSDVYAMGGKPLTAMNIVAFPIGALGDEVLLQILQGGQSKVTEGQAVIVGGHTIYDEEPKYGLSVTGIVHPNKIWTNASAQKEDLLVLTKAIGTGVLATAARAEMFPLGVAAAIQSMVTLNKQAAEVASQFNIHSCTDITGFGLLGHLYEMASASQVKVEISKKAVPFLVEALDAATMGLVPAGAYSNRDYLKSIIFDHGVEEPIRDLCFDPQTSGGLLFSLPKNEAEKLVSALRNVGISQATIIGEVNGEGSGEIHVY